MDKKIKKLNFLSLKQKSKAKTTRKDNETQFSDIPDVTSVPDDDHNPSDNKLDDAENSGDNNSKPKPKKIKRKHVKKTVYRRQQKKLKKQKISVVFNYSGIKLSKGAEAVLNRGLNFSILPLSISWHLAKWPRPSL